MNEKLKNYGTINLNFSQDKPKIKQKNPQYLHTWQVTIIRNFKGPRVLGMCRTSFFFKTYFLLYILFVVGGAAIFSYLEKPGETLIKAELHSALDKFLREHPTVTDQALEDLLVEVIKASNRGVLATRNVSGESNWSFGQSIFFSTTVVTTIGYGHVTPLSRSGKIFCIIFALIGIPLTLVLSSAIVDRLLIPTIWLLQWLNSKLGYLHRPLNIRLLHLLIIVFLLITIFMLIPAAIFSHIEPDWDYFDSVYYCFISLTTIGLGDYIPGDTPNQPYRPIYKIATAFYLFCGITVMMLTLAVFYDIPQLNLGLLFTENDGEDSLEKLRLAGDGPGFQYGAGETYSPGDDNTHRQVVRVRSRRNDSPSPEESAPIKDYSLP